MLERLPIIGFRAVQMGVFTSLKDHFIIAMPNLLDPNFSRSVTYICEHTPEGAMGIIINYPLSIHLGDIFENMEIISDDEDLNDMIVLAGGPIQQERGFVIHQPSEDQWESSLELNDNLCITTSKDILEAMANHDGPENAIIALGYAGWGAGQLEQEISENSWLLSPASSKILFETPPDKRWHAAAKLVGVNIEHISTDIGHA